MHIQTLSRENFPQKLQFSDHDSSKKKFVYLIGNRIGRVSLFNYSLQIVIMAEKHINVYDNKLGKYESS